ncbi:hypothetical protein M9194_17635 [Vibrio sp. S4M6]|uniref:hypothetical protein n=1 Tax=Vibrio sinus TaxID=2946865 RepID=UPI002029D82F|nr:hypothetical protein [Vibrio sinus]MCL9783254.1 hypothetical protein [Vibrio sinus]
MEKNSTSADNFESLIEELNSARSELNTFLATAGVADNIEDCGCFNEGAMTLIDEKRSTIVQLEQRVASFYKR